MGPVTPETEHRAAEIRMEIDKLLGVDSISPDFYWPDGTPGWRSGEQAMHTIEMMREAEEARKRRTR